LVVRGAHQLLELLKNTFDGKEAGIFKAPDGTTAHAEVIIATRPS
jgi:hypothetical protein